MKKLLAVILILSLILPAAALASTEEELIGTWVGSSEFYYGEVTYFLVRLYDDHTAIYEANKVQFFEPYPDAVSHDGKWELKEDGVHIYYKNGRDPSKDEDLVLYLTQAHYLAMKLAASYVLFTKLPERRSIKEIHTVTSWD